MSFKGGTGGQKLSPHSAFILFTFCRYTWQWSIVRVITLTHSQPANH